jgi:membrane protein implicated in regulation of membrane protease activity
MCHIVFLLPLLAVAVFFFLPPGQAAFVSVPLFLVFVWLAWVTWKDMRRPVSTGIEGLMGGKAQVVGKTRDGAKVSLRGELWDAVSDDELTMGDTVRVTRFERMKLVVRKDVNSRG